ncbi:ATP-grasp domain-containing protein [Halomonas stenophila]|uniref:Carbamoyl-phosphate synthase large subunit n=1 Tax=Halomonas stenophila TaxID=795312 RepID=A0A7W5EQT2_9GAMM|nr:ATP-grasp domain-containing protein [Halomonas stenophila]MBB3229596.1 carbamoyl-phosphate synthase large subunit [Halomonas stenophila]
MIITRCWPAIASLPPTSLRAETLNILLTCAGRRHYLVEYFRRALQGRGRVLTADSSPHAIALHAADKGIVVPPISDPGYVTRLLALCLAEDVELVVPLNDHELPVLAEHRDRFQQVGVEVVVSSPQVVAKAADKLATVRFAREAGVSTATTYTRLSDALAGLSQGHLTFPLFVKPRWGTASIGIERVTGREELELVWRRADLVEASRGRPVEAERATGLLIQEALPGLEYGLDVINDLAGRYQATLVRRKLSMRAGETDCAITEACPALVEIGRRIGEALGHVGNLDCDVFWDGKRGHLLEMNPRFGGGYPFSAEAGADVPGALLAWAERRDPPAGWASPEPGVVTGKYYDLMRTGLLMAERRPVQARLAPGIS